MEIRDVLTNIKKYDAWDYKNYPLRKEEADAIIENYKEPCEDAVSRAEVMKLSQHKPEYGDMIYAFDVSILPSVQPISKSVIEDIKAEIDEQTEIHTDGEFYIKNIDVKRILDKHIADMRGNE